MAEVGIFKLPLELREQIYQHLMPRTPVLFLVQRLGIQRASRKPPELPLLLVHARLSSELLDFFADNTMWTLRPSPSVSFSSANDHIKRLAQSPALRLMRNVELVIFQQETDLHILAHLGPPDPFMRAAFLRVGLETVMSTFCDVLARARLERIFVTWCDTDLTSQWKDKAEVFLPLTRMKGHVQVVLGSLKNFDNQEREVFASDFAALFGPEACASSKHREDLMDLDKLVKVSSEIDSLVDARSL